VTLAGAAFGDGAGGSTVTVDGVSAEVVTWSDDLITVSVPDLLPGDRPVVVTVDGTSSPPATFRVTLPPRVYVSLGTPTDDQLAAFEVAADGGLTALVGSPFSVGQEGDFFFGGVPGNLAVDEGRRRLFVSGTTDIATFDLDGVTGAPAFAARTSPAAAQYIFGIAVTPDGGHLYASRCFEEDLVHYQVGTDGGLSVAPEGPVSVGNCGDQLLVTPDGAHLYVGLGNEVRAFSIGAGGALTEVAGSAGSLASSSYGHGLSPDGSQLYAASYDGGNVYGFDVAATGALTALAGSPFSAGSRPDSRTASP
jgi:6-phosphogluconolactonase